MKIMLCGAITSRPKTFRAAFAEAEKKMTEYAELHGDEACIVGAFAIYRCMAEGSLSKPEAVANGILQFVFCADVVSAIVVFVKS